MKKDKIVSLAKRNLVEGERWHKKVNVREIVFGFNDGSISTLALLAGVTGGALAHGRARRDNCPVGQLFEGAGIPVNYNLKIIKK